MAAVVLDRVSKRYVARGPVAVRDVSLHVNNGELVVLVGPSGCGKSTILRMIAGLEAVTSGDIVIGGRVVNSLSPRDRHVGMVFQDSGLYPHMTAYQNLAFALRMRKISTHEIDRRVRETASALGMSDLLERKPGTLSGGQQQRIALGRALVRVPGASCLLFDEPLSNLDAGLRVAMRHEIKGLHQRLNATVLHVTHDQEEAMTLGDRLVVMAEGSVQQDGSPLDLYQRPCNRFVAGFIGSPAMNFVGGSVLREGERMMFAETGTEGVRIDLSSMDFQGIDHVVLGVRPEHVVVMRETAGPAHDQWLARVRVVERRGNEIILYAETTTGNVIIARLTPAESFSAGDSIRLGVNPSHVHLFRPGPFGERITSSAESN